MQSSRARHAPTARGQVEPPARPEDDRLAAVLLGDGSERVSSSARNTARAIRLPMDHTHAYPSRAPATRETTIMVGPSGVTFTRSPGSNASKVPPVALKNIHACRNRAVHPRSQRLQLSDDVPEGRIEEFPSERLGEPRRVSDRDRERGDYDREVVVEWS